MTILKKIPKHVAIIMDGNGRWAESRNHIRVYGHIRGASKIKSIVKEADRLGIKALTLYAFSTENWSRPETEKNVLWKLLIKYLVKEVNALEKENVCLRVIGEKERLPKEVLKVLEPSIERLSGNTGLQLNFAVSYGARTELIRASRLFAKDCVDGIAKPDDMSSELMNKYLWTSELKELSDVDLVIRTSGEKRISNFLLWQSAYAEYYFLDIFWPDFSADELRRAVENFSLRERRFGAVAQNK